MHVTATCDLSTATTNFRMVSIGSIIFIHFSLSGSFNYTRRAINVFNCIFFIFMVFLYRLQCFNNASEAYLLALTRATQVSICIFYMVAKKTLWKAYNLRLIYNFSASLMHVKQNIRAT